MEHSDDYHETPPILHDLYYRIVDGVPVLDKPNES